MNVTKILDSKQRAGALLLLLFSIAYLRQALSIPLNPAADEVFSARTLPVGLAVATILLSLLQILMPREPGGGIGDTLRNLHWREPILLVLLMAVYALAFDFLGFLLAGILFLQASFLVLGERHLIRSVAVSAGLVGFIWFILTQVFGLYLDSGAIHRAIFG